MYQTIVHHEGATALTGAITKVGFSGSVIKLGLDIHSRLYVIVAQYDGLLPKAPRRFAPQEFVPWVESLLRAGHTVHGSPITGIPIPFRLLGCLRGLWFRLRPSTGSCWPSARTVT